MLISPKDLISNSIDYCNVLNIRPPPWLNEQHEHQIVRSLFEILVLVFGFILLWPLIELVFRSIWKHLWEFTSVGQIARKISTRPLPKDFDWNSLHETKNKKLRKKLVGRTAAIDFTVDAVLLETQGKYRDFYKVLAKATDDQTTGLPILLYAYFDGAGIDTLDQVRRHTNNDRISVEGKISRCDIVVQNGKGYCLNIDLNGCRIFT
jgi:hypothetical protein